MPAVHGSIDVGTADGDAGGKRELHIDTGRIGSSRVANRERVAEICADRRGGGVAAFHLHGGVDR